MSSDDESQRNKRRRFVSGSVKEQGSSSSSSTRSSHRQPSVEEPLEIRGGRNDYSETAARYPHSFPHPESLPPRQTDLSMRTSLLQRLRPENEYLQDTPERNQALNLRGGNNHPVLQRDLQRSLGMMSEQMHAPGLLGGDSYFHSGAPGNSSRSMLPFGNSFSGASTYDQLLMRDQATPHQQITSSSDDPLLMNRARGLASSTLAQQLPWYGTTVSGDPSSEYLRTSALPTSSVAAMPPQQDGGGRSALPSMFLGGIVPNLDSVRGGSNFAQRYPLAAALLTHSLLGGSSQVDFESEINRIRREVMMEPGLNLLNQNFMGEPSVETNPVAITLYRNGDEETLSQYQCIVRKQIEIFAAGTVDVETSAQGRNKPIVLGQVGIRCLHCAGVHPKRRGRGGTYYPSKLTGFYQAAQNMASAHLCQCCTHVPDVLRQQLLILRERKSSAGGGKDYWAESAKALGVIEDEKMGILRFAKNEEEEYDEDSEVKDDTKASAVTEET